MFDLAQAKSSPDDLSILLAGDLILDVEDPDYWLSGIAPVIRSADIAIGHLEVPHTDRTTEHSADIPAPGARPEHLDALKNAGFSAVTLGGNHIADCGPGGIADTINRLDLLGLAHTGAGANLEEASRPAEMRSRNRTIALLSYNCVGPEASWADTDHAGCNYLRMVTDDGGMVTPQATLTDVTEDALGRLTDDIVAARDHADIVIVGLHKGLVHIPAVVLSYERKLASAALAAGADIVVGHHAHILRGIELADGRPVFHGLGNGCVVTRALSPDQAHPGRAAWAAKRRELFGFEPDPRYEFAPFHPEAVNGLLGVVIVHENGELSTGAFAIDVEPPGRPVCATPDCGERVIRYVEQIGARAGLRSQAWHRLSDSMWMCQ